MRILFYICEEGFEKYINNVAQQHQILICTESSLLIDENEFDYLIIMTKDIDKSISIQEELLNLSIPEQKILRYCYFEKYPLQSPVELFHQKKSSCRYDVLLFGMSHAYGGCIEPLFKENIYKFAAPSMDLYYHYKVLQDISNIYPMKSVKKVIFELPYYTFNYDLSKCKHTFIQRMNYYYYYEDYHHYGKDYLERKYIDEFECLNKLCMEPVYGVRKVQLDTSLPSNIAVDRLKKLYWKLRYAFMKKEGHIWTEEEKQQLKRKHHIWYKKYQDTIEENTRIWEKIKEILSVWENIQVYVIVFPFSPDFIKFHEKAILEMKKLFEEHLNIPAENVLDCFYEYSTQTEYFLDECHLNLLGAYKFSKRMDKWLQR